MKIVEEEEEETAEIRPDPLHQLILHFSHNALTERRWDAFYGSASQQASTWTACSLFFRKQVLKKCYVQFFLHVNVTQSGFASFQPLGGRSFIYCVCRHDGKGLSPPLIENNVPLLRKYSTVSAPTVCVFQSCAEDEEEEEEEGKEKTFEVLCSCRFSQTVLATVNNCTRVCVFRLQEKEMEKQKILYQQARLHARGAAEMVLQMISASKGRNLNW